MHKGWLLVVTLLPPLVALSCAPAAPVPSGGAAVEVERSQTQLQRTLVIAVRGEPPSLASQELVAFSGSLRGHASSSTPSSIS